MDHHGLDTSPSIALAISGDPVVGRALTLLLKGSGYDTKFVFTSSLKEACVLEGVRLLVLTPTPELSADQRAALLEFLKNVPGVCQTQILELVSFPSAQVQEGEARDKAWHVVFWPCRFQELERRIERILSSAPVSGSVLGPRRY